ncbi:MAG: hypothetical protein GEV28_31495 [Actinophytocola sp.]|uniref:hypothetical protein n=1 Tax=Actinophytocola sp. TaxID=1872138 RepID=UPI00132450C3|nr:hypothetical protein [Actinophytocola sp.]MPZ84667.1 hypothetical protein [Actinophytocola sp.]
MCTTFWSEPAEVPAVLTGRVYVTLGTVEFGAVEFGAVEVPRRAVTETAAHDMDLLVAVGPDGDPAAQGE